jgi:exopolysaccharide biosynthesis protein
MMNKKKVYFNSDNNVYSSVPAAIFSTGSRFVAKSQEWGRDTGVDSVIAGQPLLVFNNQNQFGGDGDPKKSSKGTRAFMGGNGNKAYLGLIYNATVAEVAAVLTTLQIPNAINLDSGGSIAFWMNGKYLAGPGRDLPFGIMVVRR